MNNNCFNNDKIKESFFFKRFKRSEKEFNPACYLFPIIRGPILKVNGLSK